MRPLESLCFIDSYQVHRFFLVTDTLRDFDIEIVFFDEVEKIYSMIERKIILSIFIASHSLDEGSHIRKMPSIEYI